MGLQQTAAYLMNVRRRRWRNRIDLFGFDTPAGEYLGDETAGLSIDFANDSALVRGHSTDYSGTPAGLLTVARASTATYFDINGVMQSAANNVLRRDYHPVTHEALGALIEEARTNLILRSEEQDNASWTKTLCTVTANTQVAPNGLATADTLTSTDVVAVGTNQSVTTTAAAYAFSVYAKAGTCTWLRLVARVSGATTNLSAWFDLTNGALGTKQSALTTSAIQAVGNGWYRCTITWTGSASAEAIFTRLAAANNDINVGTSGLTIHLWGAQVELGGFATSYIPTVAATVARSRDEPTLAVTAFPFNQNAGTLVWEGDRQAVGAGPQAWLWSIDNGTNERLQVFTSTLAPTMFVVDGGVTQVNASDGNVANDTLHRVAHAWALNDFAMSRDGRTAVTDTAGTLPTVVTLRIGHGYTSALQINGHVKRIKHFPRRATNGELPALTT